MFLLPLNSSIVDQYQAALPDIPSVPGAEQGGQFRVPKEAGAAARGGQRVCTLLQHADPQSENLIKRIRKDRPVARRMAPPIAISIRRR